MTKTSAFEAVDRYFLSGAFESDLRDRVRYRTVSQDISARGELDRYLREIIEPELSAMGFICRRMPNPKEGGPDFLFAERIEDASLPTMLIYAHGDVVEGMDGSWSDGLDPWTLTEKDGCWYGRGTADNKGQHAVNFAALKCVLEQKGNTLGFNVKCLFEMGEECSSPGLREFCAINRDMLKANVLIASDGPRLSLDVPTIYLGSRGSVLMELTCTARKEFLHSGNWGGIVKNPASVLVNAISSIVDGRGRLKLRDLVPQDIPPSVRDVLATLDISEASMKRPLDADWGEPGLSAAERLLGWNSFEVITLDAGNADKPVNAVPPAARAHCQLRFVVGTDWNDVVPAIRRHLDDNGYRDVEVTLIRGGPATRLDPADPWVEWAVQSLSEALGSKPAVNPNIGGTVPNDAFATILGLPTIWVPHSYPGCKQHGIDEHLPKSIAHQGMRMMASLFWDFPEALKTAR